MKENKIIDSNYGSIPHLSTSKLTQQADKKIEIGQELILTEKARDFKDLIIVEEKVDGANVGIIKKEHTLIPITRKGYAANTSKFSQFHIFEKWVYSNAFLFNWLPHDWRICGEWCIMAHGTIYDITNESPFVAFDIFNEHNQRLRFLDFYYYCKKYQIPTVKVLHIGQPISIKNSLKIIDLSHYGETYQGTYYGIPTMNHYSNIDKSEGVVYRVERQSRFDWKVDFLAKWVRADKEDGKYLDKNILNIGAQKYYDLYQDSL